MKLLLTSAGLKTPELTQQARQALPQAAAEDCLAVLISYSAPEEEHYVQEAKQEIIDLGISHIQEVNMRRPVDLATLGRADVMYMCGGNTFHILSQLRATGLFQYVKMQVEQGALYIGVSAGSILAGPNIQISSWGSEGDPNDIGLEDLTGFGWTDKIIFPHFRPDLATDVESFEDEFSVKVDTLTDTQAVYVHEGKSNLIG